MSGPRFSRITREEIVYDFWLVFDEDGQMRLSRGESKLARGERAMQMTTTLPRSLWKTPQLRGSIKLTDTGAPTVNIDIDAAREALRQVTGLDIDIQVHEP